MEAFEQNTRICYEVITDDALDVLSELAAYLFLGYIIVMYGNGCGTPCDSDRIFKHCWLLQDESIIFMKS